MRALSWRPSTPSSAGILSWSAARGSTGTTACTGRSSTSTYAASGPVGSGPAPDPARRGTLLGGAMRLRPMGPTLLLLAVLGCGEATGPDARSMRIEPIGGNDQVGAPGALLDANFVVRVTSDGEPVENASIEWELVVGTDAR